MRLTKVQLAHIKTLEQDGGRLTARRLLDDAKRPKSPLHTLFNWNAKHAAERWWLHRARLIIGAVQIQVTRHQVTVESPVYVVDTTVKGDGYRNIMDLQNDSEAARESLIYTLEIAAGHLRRACDLASPLGLTKQIDALLAQIAGVVRIAQKKAA